MVRKSTKIYQKMQLCTGVFMGKNNKTLELEGFGISNIWHKTCLV